MSGRWPVGDLETSRDKDGRESAALTATVWGRAYFGVVHGLGGESGKKEKKKRENKETEEPEKQRQKESLRCSTAVPKFNQQ